MQSALGQFLAWITWGQDPSQLKAGLVKGGTTMIWMGKCYKHMFTSYMNFTQSFPVYVKKFF